MPYQTEFINEGTGILHVGSGVLKGQEIIKVVSELSGKLPHPECLTHGLIDLRSVTEFHVSTEDLKIITGIDKKHMENIKPVFVAIVAPGDLMYGVSRMYEGMMPTLGWTIQVFRTMNQAQAWLDSQLNVEI